MIDRKNLPASALALAFALAAMPALAAEAEHSQHHPGGSPPAAAAAPAQPGTGPTMPGAMGAAGQQGGMPMMGMAREGGMRGMPMMGMMCPMMGAGGMMDGMSMGSMPMMAGRTEGRVAFLKAELKITEAQLPLWNAVADALRADAKTGKGEGETAGATLPDRMAARAKILSARLETLRQLQNAVAPLYAALNEDQKKTADEILMSPMGMM